MSEPLDNLLLHARTKQLVDILVSRPPHAVLIAGANGSGKKTLANAIAARLLKVDSLEAYPYFFHVARPQNKQEIAIEQVREIIAALKLKAPGEKSVKRVIFIEDAHYLSVPAQNALLKILEEPNDDTVFLLSVDSAQGVLPTIASRAQMLEVQPVSLSDATAYFGDKFSSKTIEQAWRLSGGTVGLMQALLAEDQQHPLKEAVEQTKRFLRAKKYERLLILDGISKDKERFMLFLDAMSRTLNFLHHNTIAADKTRQADALLQSRKHIAQVQRALNNNANSKLAALDLVLNLKV